MTTKIAQFDILQIVPDAFIGIQIRGIAGQTLQVNPSGGSIAQEFFHHLSPVSRKPIPDDQELALNVPQQMLEKAHNMGPTKRLFLNARVQFPLWRHRADRREMFPEGVFQYRRLALRRPGVNGGSQQVKASLVDEDYRSPFSFGLFFIGLLTL